MAADTTKIILEKINTFIPHNLEIVWGLAKPRDATQIKNIIVASFYLPPKSKKKSKLFDHISSTLNELLCKYPDAGVVCGGDRNEFSVSPLLNLLPRMRQLVTKPTKGNKILSVIVTP